MSSLQRAQDGSLGQGSNNLHRTVSCIFKLVNTTKKFEIEIDPCKSRNNMYSSILEKVNQDLFDEPVQDIANFEIVVAGRYLAERAVGFPSDNVSIKNTVNFIGYGTSYSFYIRKKERNPELASNIVSCPVCYTSIGSVCPYTCDHTLCSLCSLNWSISCERRNISSSCPLCRARSSL